jgi:nucleotide-binding universal stress UspA family protein
LFITVFSFFIPLFWFCCDIIEYIAKIDPSPPLVGKIQKGTKGGRMISRILVPTDGTKASKKAVDYAIGLSKQTEASITILGVMDKGAFVAQSIPAYATPTRLRTPIEDYLRQLAEAHVAEAEKQCKRKRVKPETVIRSGHPVKEILKEARRSKSDLIVIGSHGKGALESVFLGSISLALIHENTKYPLLIIRG